MERSHLCVANFGKPADSLAYRTGVPWRPPHQSVVIRMVCSPINPADLNLIEGTYGVRPELPFTPGIEGAGVVVSSPDARFSPGDPVIALDRVGTWATHAAVAPDRLMMLPSGIDMRQAAMLKVNPATAWRLLKGFRTLKDGDWVVQNAGNSGVGRCLIQLAGSLGLRTISLVRRADLIDELRDLGGDHVLIDGPEAQQQALELMGGRGAELACNAVGGESALRLMNLLRDGGDHVTYGAMARRPLAIPNGLLIFRNLAIRGLWVSRWIDAAPIDELHEVYAELARRVVTGGLIQPVDSCHPLPDFHAALERQAEPGRAGKVILTMGD